MLLPFLSAFFTATLLPHLLSANPPFADRAKHRHDKVIVCVSGGKDSVVALLAALAIYGRERVVAHHCLVEEDWERTVEYIQGLLVNSLKGGPILHRRVEICTEGWN